MELVVKLEEASETHSCVGGGGCDMLVCWANYWQRAVQRVHGLFLGQSHIVSI